MHFRKSIKSLWLINVVSNNYSDHNKVLYLDDDMRIDGKYDDEGKARV
jgi:hypothetical protein